MLPDRLHPVLGLNARAVLCPRCSTPHPAFPVVLMGHRNLKIRCSSCGTVNYGSESENPCGVCEQSLASSEAVELRSDEQIVSGYLCPTCVDDVLNAEDREAALLTLPNYKPDKSIPILCKSCGNLIYVDKDSPAGEKILERLITLSSRSLVGIVLNDCSKCNAKRAKMVSRAPVKGKRPATLTVVKPEQAD